MTRDELISALRTAPVGSCDLDADFMEVIGFEVALVGRWRYRAASYWYAIPHVSSDETSIIRMIRRDFPHSRLMLQTERDGDRFVAEVWGVGVDHSVNDAASTPALALCIAYLVAGKDGHD